MNRVLALVTAATVLISLSTLAHANLIVNSSFEDPVVAVGGVRTFTAASTPPLGWSVVGPGSLAIVSGTFTQFGFSFPAQDGVQWLDLTGISSNQPIGIQQVVATVSGTTYDLSFWVGNVVGFVNSAAITSTVNLFIDGSSALAATNTGGGTTLNWQEFTTSFTATGTTTTLGFFNGDPPTDENNGLDNIVLTARSADGAPSPVSGPAALLLLGAGLAGLAAVRLCQKALREEEAAIRPRQRFATGGVWILGSL